MVPSMDGLAERIKELGLRGELSVSLVALNNICKGLGVTLSEFFREVDDVNPPEYRARGDAPASRHDVVVNTTNGAIKYLFI